VLSGLLYLVLSLCISQRLHLIYIHWRSAKSFAGWRGRLTSRQKFNMEFIDCKRIVFQGVARVSLQSISFSLGGIDENKVLRLTNTFLAEGCLRHKEMNHITALIDDRQLNEALHKANLDRGTLSSTKPNNEEHSMLTFPADYTLCGLRGRHRIFAGRGFLVEKDRWWKIRLYVQSKWSKCTPNNFVLSLHRHLINVNCFVFLTSH